MAKKVIRQKPRTTRKPRQTINQARKLIFDDRLIAFLRAARPDAAVHAVELGNRHLDNGYTLDQIFSVGKPDGFFLSVEKLRDLAFRITFSCLANPLAGDGGSWEVEFDDRGTVRSLTGGGRWIS